jgi:hypothetical protein
MLKFKKLNIFFFFFKIKINYFFFYQNLAVGFPAAKTDSPLINSAS